MASGWTQVERDGGRAERRDAPAKRVEHLLRLPEVDVLLLYGPGAPTELPPGRPGGALAAVPPYVREPTLRASGNYTDLRAAEFKDEQRRLLLFIEGSC